MKLTSITDFKVNRTVKGFYQLTRMTRRTTRRGEPFLDCVLSDKTGLVSAKWWNLPEGAVEWLQSGMVVAATGDVEEYNGQLQLVVDQITPATETQVERFGLRYQDIVPSTPYDVTEMWEETLAVMDTMTDEHLRDLVRTIYLEFEEEIKSHPGSVAHHHMYRGGFLEHVWSLAALGNLVAEHYFELNRDLFLAGLLLHDIGKLLEIKSDLDRQYTDEGQFLGHLVLGRDILREAVADHFPDFPDQLLLQLEHIILAHHGELDQGSPKRPASLEALVVSQLDRLDTSVQQFLTTLTADSNTGEWTHPTHRFPYRLYKGGRESDE